MPSRNCKDHSALMQLLSKWLRDNQTNHLPAMKVPFPFTGINVNFGYGARLHRDKNNEGLPPPQLCKRLLVSTVHVQLYGKDSNFTPQKMWHGVRYDTRPVAREPTWLRKVGA